MEKWFLAEVDQTRRVFAFVVFGVPKTHPGHWHMWEWP